MNWQEDYKRKIVSADEAVKAAKSRGRIKFGFPRQETLLTPALAARKDYLKNVDMLIQNPRIDDGWLEPSVLSYEFVGKVSYIAAYIA